VTFIAEFLVVISMVVTFRLASTYWGEGGFGEWILSRRLLALLGPIITCGLDYALIQVIVRQITDEQPAEVRRYFVAALVIVGLLSAVSATAMLSMPELTAATLYGDSRFSELVVPLVLMLTANGFYVAVYAYYRGTLQFIPAAIIHVVMFGVIPVTSVVGFQDNPRLALIAVGVLSLVFSLVLAYFIAARAVIALANIVQHVRNLIGSGSPRIVSAVGLISLSALPAVLVAHFADISRAGQVAFGLTLVGMVATSLTPLNVYLFPQLSHARYSGRHLEFTQDLSRLHRWFLILSLALIVAAWYGASAIVRAFLGYPSAGAELTLRIAAVAAGPYAYFLVLRSWIEAWLDASVIVHHVLAALVVFAVVLLAGRVSGVDSVLLVLAAYLAAVVALAALSFRSTYIALERN
jgi:O-antigen/teichoic acid export membrane protein